jgi:hypothetical protein
MKNKDKFIIQPPYFVINVGKGRRALVDRCDFDRVRPCGRWSAYYCKSSKTYYIKCSVKKHIFYNYRLHRFITKLSFGDRREVDHINHNGLDNRRCNLRIVNKSQQNMNVRPFGSIDYKGVSKTGGKYNQYIVRIQKNGSQKTYGVFYTQKMAAIVYDYYAKKVFGEYAYLNLPNITITLLKQIIRWERIIRKMRQSMRNKSGYIGVTCVKGKYESRIILKQYGKQKMLILGKFNNPKDAAICYDNYIKLHCSGRDLNFG